MERVTIKKIDNTVVFIDCPADIRMELWEEYSFLIPNHKHHPLVKARRWNGMIHLYNKSKSTLHVGLVPEVVKFIVSRGYDLSMSPEVMSCFNDKSVTQESFSKFIKSFELADDYHEKLQWRDYQLRMIYLAAKSKRATFLSATSTGKSASIYGIMRYLQNVVSGKILVIVPNTVLVEQLFSDFRNYSYNDDEWTVEDNCERLYAKYNLTRSKHILISTWQSLLPIAKDKNDDPREFFDSFDAVVVDECFSGDTKVLTPEGWKEIQHLTKGDFILNNDSEGNIKRDEVVKLHENLVHSLSEDMYKVEFDNGTILNVTGNHKILTSSGEWKRIDTLTEEDDILCVNTELTQRC